MHHIWNWAPAKTSLRSLGAPKLTPRGSLWSSLFQIRLARWPFLKICLGIVDNMLMQDTVRYWYREAWQHHLLCDLFTLIQFLGVFPCMTALMAYKYGISMLLVVSHTCTRTDVDSTGLPLQCDCTRAKPTGNCSLAIHLLTSCFISCGHILAYTEIMQHWCRDLTESSPIGFAKNSSQVVQLKEHVSPS